MVRGETLGVSSFLGERALRYGDCMSALMWWLIPLGATVLALGYAFYRGRPDRPMEGAEGMQTLRAFQDAMERPLPPEVHDDLDEPRP
ncbi:unannotated protein [freshwater metagenome]|uniref:Unannotated protein n=1 Tax=freshwater metagenome TaxID=449393 RepID=A0A6J7HB72_9ZZZZ